MTSSDFLSASERVKKLPSLPNEILLRLYSLYKQATEGDIKGSRPGIFDLKARAKFDAWMSLKGLAPLEAEKEYIHLVQELEASHDHDNEM
jgi:diazepam-binding inhibitor (GABA receptor modulator, acyl-CoA-binding protein)